MKGSAQTIGLKKTADLCYEVMNLTQERKRWIGYKYDGDDSDDAHCLARVKQLYEEIKMDTEKWEKFFKDFFYTIQGPEYDLQHLESGLEAPLVNEQEGDGVKKPAKDLPEAASTTLKDSVD